jgi:predicted MPP superfamily phosphohydrolase
MPTVGPTIPGCRTGQRPARGPLTRFLRWLVAGGVLLAGYMLFEAQWLRRNESTLPVPDLPEALDGLTILHLSDVHGDQPGLNLWTLQKALRWAVQKRPDLVVITGDLLSGEAFGGRRCLELVASLRPPLGTYAVPGNHEYGLSKNPFSHRPTAVDWAGAGITLLRDRCVLVPTAAAQGLEGRGRGARLVVCGADYLTGGHTLEGIPPEEADFAFLLVHRPPEPEDPLGTRFSLAFAGHTHGGQIRFPTPSGPASLHDERLPYLQGIHPWGRGVLAISAGIGTTFLPFRLLTRPEVSLYHLTPVA